MIPIKKTASLENAKIDMINANYRQIESKQSQLAKTVEAMQEQLQVYMKRMDDVEASTKNLQKMEKEATELSEKVLKKSPQKERSDERLVTQSFETYKRDHEKEQEAYEEFKKKVSKDLESLRTISTRLTTDLYATKKDG